MANDADDLRMQAERCNYETSVSGGMVPFGSAGQTNESLKLKKIAAEVDSYYLWLEEQKNKKKELENV